MPGPLELDTRRRLYRHIQANPGMYLRELQRALDMAMGQLEYHLQELEKAGLVVCLNDTNKRFFSNQIPRADRAVLAMLRQALPRRILMLVMQEGIASKRFLTDALDLPRSTVNHHVIRLVEAGLLLAGREGRDAVYQVVDEGNVLRLLVAYQSSLLDRMVDAFLAGTGSLR